MNHYQAIELQHYGVLGMKWGVRKKSKSPSVKTSKKAFNFLRNKKSKDAEKVYKKASSKTKSNFEKKRKNVKKMSDVELESRIARLEKEKKYKELNKATMSEGRKVTNKIISNAVENVGTQALVWVLGTGVNKATKRNIVNPKKGQKDK